MRLLDSPRLELSGSIPPAVLGARSTATEELRDELVVAHSEPAAGVILMRLRGELDMATARRARQVLFAAVDMVASETARPSGREANRLRGRVVCDLEGVDFLAVAGLRVLVEVSRRAHAWGVELELVASGRPVRRALELTGLDDFFVITPGPACAAAPATTPTGAPAAAS